jgi:hypothetical protein
MTTATTFEYLSPAETANRLGVSAQRVAQLRRAGELPALRTPLGHLYERDAVERLADVRAQRRSTSVATSGR